MSNLALGAPHNVTVRAVRSPACDGAALVSTLSWFEPETGPGAVSFTAAPAGAVFSSFATFGFSSSAVPGTTLFQYSLDGSSWAPCSATLRVGPLAPGPHSVSVRSSDGVTVSANKSVSWTVLSQSSYQLQVCRGGGCARVARCNVDI